MIECFALAKPKPETPESNFSKIEAAFCQTAKSKFQDARKKTEKALRYKSPFTRKKSTKGQVKLQKNLAAFGRHLDQCRLNKNKAQQEECVKSEIKNLFGGNEDSSKLLKNLSHVLTKAIPESNACKQLKQGSALYLQQTLRYIAWYLETQDTPGEDPQTETQQKQKLKEQNYHCFRDFKSKVNPKEEESYLSFLYPESSSKPGASLREDQEVLPKIIGLSGIQEDKWDSIFKTFKELQTEEEQRAFMKYFQELWLDASFVCKFFMSCPESLDLCLEDPKKLGSFFNERENAKNKEIHWTALNLAKQLVKDRKNIQQGRYDFNKQSEKFKDFQDVYKEMLSAACMLSPREDFNEDATKAILDSDDEAFEVLKHNLSQDEENEEIKDILRYVKTLSEDNPSYTLQQNQNMKLRKLEKIHMKLQNLTSPDNYSNIENIKSSLAFKHFLKQVNDPKYAWMPEVWILLGIADPVAFNKCVFEALQSKNSSVFHSIREAISELNSDHGLVKLTKHHFPAELAKKEGVFEWFAEKAKIEGYDFSKLEGVPDSLDQESQTSLKTWLSTPKSNEDMVLPEIKAIRNTPKLAAAAAA